jgi:hypothetical protein
MTTPATVRMPWLIQKRKDPAGFAAQRGLMRDLVELLAKAVTSHQQPTTPFGDMDGIGILPDRPQQRDEPWKSRQKRTP